MSIKITCLDGLVVEAPVETHFKCTGLLKRIVAEDFEEDGSLSIDINSIALNRVFEYCTSKHYPSEERIKAGGPFVDLNFQSEYEKFLSELDPMDLCEMATAAYYLEVKPLTEIACRAIAEHVKKGVFKPCKSNFRAEREFDDMLCRDIMERSVMKQLVAGTTTDFKFDGYPKDRTLSTRERLFVKLMNRKQNKIYGKMTRTELQQFADDRLRNTSRATHPEPLLTNHTTSSAPSSSKKKKRRKNRKKKRKEQSSIPEPPRLDPEIRSQLNLLVNRFGYSLEDPLDHQDEQSEHHHTEPLHLCMNNDPLIPNSVLPTYRQYGAFVKRGILSSIGKKVEGKMVHLQHNESRQGGN